MAWFRLLFSAADGGPPPGGADVELTYTWHNKSPIVPTSGRVSRSVLSLLRASHWDSAVQILENDVGNPDGTLTIRITGCERNVCVIGDPSEITVAIADDDGGPETAPPGRPDPPRLVCASAGGGYDSTGIAVSWQAPTFVGGAAIDGYDVQYRRRVADGDQRVWSDWQAWPHNGTAISTAITGLDTDTLYGVQVRALNANGPGQWSLPNTFWTGQSDKNLRDPRRTHPVVVEAPALSLACGPQSRSSLCGPQPRYCTTDPEREQSGGDAAGRRSLVTVVTPADQADSWRLRPRIRRRDRRRCCDCRRRRVSRCRGSGDCLGAGVPGQRAGDDSLRVRVGCCERERRRDDERDPTGRPDSAGHSRAVRPDPGGCDH